MILRIIMFILLISVFFINPYTAAEDNPVLAKAGNYSFRQSDFDRLISFSPPYFREQLDNNPQQKVTIIKKIMEQKIIADLAREKGLDKHDDTQIQMQYLINDLLSREYLIKIVKKGVTVTEEDAKQYFEDNKNKYIIPEQVRVRHILIKVPFGASDEEAKKAEEKAKNILNWLKKGEKFKTLAEQYSEDEASAKKGGDLGYIPKGRMAKTFEEAAFSMKPGEISEAVRTSLGYHIIMLEDHREEQEKKFEEVKEAIKKQLQDERERSTVIEFIKNASDNAGLEVYNDTITGNVKKE
jgi:peptidyl-prolyl cis-trans isomerase C